ncbi:MAG: WD40 repeat domain-containing protein [Limisphaerales bacterium]
MKLNSHNSIWKSISLSVITTVSAAAAACGAEEPSTPASLWDATAAGPIAFSPDSALLLTAGENHVVQLRKVPSGEVERTFERAGEVIRSVAISPDQSLVVSAGSDAVVRLWDLPSGRESRTLKGHSAVIQCIAFSAHGKKLASGCSDKTIRIWEVPSGRSVLTLHQPAGIGGAPPSMGFPGQVFAVAFSPDGTLLASGGGDGVGAYGELVLWDLKSKQLRQRLLRSGEQQVWSVAFTPDGKRLVSGLVNGRVNVFDVQTGTAVGQMEAGESLRSLAISPDGTTLATGTLESIRLWDLADNQLKRTFKLPGDFMVASLVFSPNGKWLASAGRRVRLWELPRRK